MTATYKHDGFTFMRRDLTKKGHALPVNVRIRNAVRWIGRTVLRFSDWVDRNAPTILATIVVVVLILGVTLVLAFYNLRFLAVMVSLVGLVGVTAVVAYKAGASQ